MAVHVGLGATGQGLVGQRKSVTVRIGGICPGVLRTGNAVPAAYVSGGFGKRDTR